MPKNEKCRAFRVHCEERISDGDKERGEMKRDFESRKKELDDKSKSEVKEE